MRLRDSSVLGRLDSSWGQRVEFYKGESGSFVMSSQAMSNQVKTYIKFGGAAAVIVLLLGYLAYTGVQDSKSYYVTIKELRAMGDGAYAKRLRVAGNVQPGSIKRNGTHVQFVLVEETQSVAVDYSGTEAPPDTFKDDSQALADGSFGRDGVFHAKGLQAKCASKYAPGTPANGMPAAAPNKSVTQVPESSTVVAN
jgi:cytochrome c-type biogenesis protein CcmE